MQNLISNQNFEELIKIDIQKAIEYEKNSPNPKFHRTFEEKNLTDSFFLKFKNDIEEFEQSIYNLALSTNTNDINLKISALSSLINKFYEFREFCISKGIGGNLYFQDMWLHCHNSNNSDFSYIYQFEQDLIYILENKEQLKKQELFKLTIENNLLDLILKNEGILQTDIYKFFSSEYKNIIQEKLYYLSKLNKIKRKKYKNTYKIFINSNT